MQGPGDDEQRRKAEEERLDKKREEAKAGRFKSAVMAVISLASIGVFVYSQIPKRKHDKREEEPADKHALHERTTTTTETPTTTTKKVPEPTPIISIASCTCISHANGKNTFVLERLADASAWHVSWQQSSSALLLTSSFWPGASDAGSATSLPSLATQLHAVMACENDILAVVAGDVASAWTGTDRGELLWTRKLPAPYAFPNDAGVDEFACAPALGVTGNVFTVPLAKGKTIALSIRDGSSVTSR